MTPSFPQLMFAYSFVGILYASYFFSSFEKEKIREIYQMMLPQVPSHPKMVTFVLFMMLFFLFIGASICWPFFVLLKLMGWIYRLTRSKADE